MKLLNTSYLMLLLIVLINNVSCYHKNVAPTPKKVLFSNSVTTENVTYSNYVHKILLSNCSTCHGERGSAKVYWLNENTYDNAKKYGKPISVTIHNSTMPPPPKFPFSNKERELIVAWVKNGYKF